MLRTVGFEDLDFDRLFALNFTKGLLRYFDVYSIPHPIFFVTFLFILFERFLFVLNC
jgi:hypothetical protein